MEKNFLKETFIFIVWIAYGFFFHFCFWLCVCCCTTCVSCCQGVQKMPSVPLDLKFQMVVGWELSLFSVRVGGALKCYTNLKLFPNFSVVLKQFTSVSFVLQNPHLHKLTWSDGNSTMLKSMPHPTACYANCTANKISIFLNCWAVEKGEYFVTC